MYTSKWGSIRRSVKGPHDQSRTFQKHSTRLHEGHPCTPSCMTPAFLVICEPETRLEGPLICEIFLAIDAVVRQHPLP